MGLRASLFSNPPFSRILSQKQHHAPPIGAKSAGKAPGKLLSRCTSNCVFIYRSASNHVSEHNSYRWCPAAPSVGNDLRRLGCGSKLTAAKPSIVSQRRIRQKSRPGRKLFYAWPVCQRIRLITSTNAFKYKMATTRRIRLPIPHSCDFLRIDSSDNCERPMTVEDFADDVAIENFTAFMGFQLASECRQSCRRSS